jgi:hypothetical protein
MPRDVSLVADVATDGADWFEFGDGLAVGLAVGITLMRQAVNFGPVEGPGECDLCGKCFKARWRIVSEFGVERYRAEGGLTLARPWAVPPGESFGVGRPCGPCIDLLHDNPEKLFVQMMAFHGVAWN